MLPTLSSYTLDEMLAARTEVKVRKEMGQKHDKI